MKIHTTLLVGCLTALVTIRPAAAQSNPQPQSAAELRRQLDALRAQMDAQAKLMNELQARLDELEKAKAAPAARCGGG